MTLKEKIQSEIKDTLIIALTKSGGDYLLMIENDVDTIINMVEVEVVNALSDTLEEEEALTKKLRKFKKYNEY
jgi:hypothetical protein